MQSTAWDSGVYRIGDDIQVTVTFSENVTVTGSPQLELAVGSNNRTASYDSTDGTKVVFSYTVAEGDTDSDGITIGANKLTLNSGSIKDGADNDANLAHSALAAQDGHKVDGVRPRLQSLYFAASSGGSDGAYSANETLIIVARFRTSDGLIRGSVSGPPQVKLDLTGKEKAASWDYSLRFNDQRKYVAYFGYVVQNGDLDRNGPAISANSVNLNGGFIRDSAGNDAVLTHSAVTGSTDFIVDAVAPTVSSIAITSDPGDDNTYGTGDKIEVTVTFSENMTLPSSIVCSPDVVYCKAELELNIGGTAKTADYQSHTGADVIFAYTVQAGDTDDNGVSIDANKLTGQRIMDAAGKNGEGINDADLSHTGVADDVGHKVLTTSQSNMASTDASLSALTLSDVDFGTFASDTASYTAQVANSVAQTTVTPTVNHSGAGYVMKLDGVTDADDVIDLSVGSNVITIEVTAEDGQTTMTYKVMVTRAAPSTDATLKSLALSGIDIGGGLGDPEYIQTQTSFTANIYHSVSQTTVTPRVNNSGASYVIKLGGVTDADGVFSLAVGSNVITVEVTAADGQTTKTYTATVNRASASAPTTGELSTDDPRVNFHTIHYSHSSVTLSVSFPRNRGIIGVVTQRYEHDGDSFVSAGVDGRYQKSFDDDLGGDSLSWSFVEADPDSLYKWVVTMLNSQNATVIETSLEVRTPPEPGSTVLSSDATLSNLTLSGIDIEAEDRTFVGPGFHPGVTNYVGSAANSLTETTLTPTVNHAGASYVIKLGGVTDADGTVPLAVGSNAITVEVTAENRQTTRTYTVTVARATSGGGGPTPPQASSDASLSGLALSGVDFGTFASQTTSYTAQVANSVSQTTVTPTVNHSGASYVIKLGGVAVADGVIELGVGSNVITVEVTAEDDSTSRTYTVTVARAAPPSTDATLSALTLSGVDFGTFASDTTSYTAQVANSVSQTTVTPTVNHSGASYVIKLGGVADADGVIELGVGSNVITIEVTAEDRQTTRTYTVTVTRATSGDGPPTPPQASSDASLSGLTLSGVDFGTFASETTSYTAQVANSVSQTTVTPTVNHSGASYVIKLGGVEDADGEISLEVGSNGITIEVTAEDDSTSRTYTVTVARAAPPSTDATLSALTLSGVDFGTFDSTTTSYTAQVANSVSQTTVTPTVNESGASYVIKLGGVADADGVIALSVGSNVVTVVVTAEDGSATQTYTVTVTREGLSTEETGAEREQRLIGQYDTDGDIAIDLGELFTAIDDYFDQLLSIEELFVVIDLYFSG